MFAYIVLLASFLLATCAAWFSVSGISHLFIGAPIAAMAMAIALEFGKIVSVSYLYRYWSVINKAIKTYMIMGSVILMLITSVGIYGYLTAAYATSAVDFTNQISKTEQVERQIQSTDNIISSINTRIAQLNTTRNNQEDRLNQLVGKSGFLTQQRVVRETESQLSSLQTQLQEQQNKRAELDSAVVVSKSAITQNSKIGTFYYVAKSLNVELDTVVKWFVLIIVLVFDPMSLALILAYNSIVEKKKLSTDSNIWLPSPIKMTPHGVTTLTNVSPNIVNTPTIPETRSFTSHTNDSQISEATAEKLVEVSEAVKLPVDPIQSESLQSESEEFKSPKPWWGRPDGGQSIA